MLYEPLTQLLNDMAADYMFLAGAEVDIPAAGKFMNTLDQVSQQASENNIASVKEVAGWLTILLEKIVLDSLPDKEKGFLALGEGIFLLQAIRRRVCPFRQVRRQYCRIWE